MPLLLGCGRAHDFTSEKGKAEDKMEDRGKQYLQRKDTIEEEVHDPSAAGQAKAEDMSDDEFLRRARPIQDRSMKATLELAALCGSKQTFTSRSKCLRQLRLSEAKFSKMQKIGRDTRLKDESLIDLLPKSGDYTVVYAICLLSEDQLRQARADGVISPSVTRSQIENFRAGKAADASKPRRGQKRFAIVTIPEGLEDEKGKVLRERLAQLCEEYGAELDAGRLVNTARRRLKADGVNPVL